MEKRILALLQKDASLSSSEIAEPVNSSQSTVRRRTNSLEKSANIDEKKRRYGAVKTILSTD